MLNWWGIQISDQKVQELFDYLDLDKDGKISYKDFQNTIGLEITPWEGLYFRQDKPVEKDATCKQQNCWNLLTGLSKFCALHQKLNLDRCIEHFQTLLAKLSKDEKDLFNEKLSRGMNISKENTIEISMFIKILEVFTRSKLPLEIQDWYIESFQMRQDGNYKDLDITPLMNRNTHLDQLYESIDLFEDQIQEEMKRSGMAVAYTSDEFKQFIWV